MEEEEEKQSEELLTQRSKAPKHSRQQLGMPPKMSASRFGCYSSFLF